MESTYEYNERFNEYDNDFNCEREWENLQEMTRFDIPEISLKKVKQLFLRIKPVVRKNDSLFFIADRHPVKKSFSFGPVETTTEAKRLQKIGTVLFFSSSYPIFWKPSMKEVFAFIQDYPNLNLVCAVEVEYMSHHRKIDGNIGKITLYKLNFN